MADLPQKKTTVDAIYRHYEVNQGGHRPHLGASEIGHACERFLWYKFRHAFNSVFSGRMLKLFQRGHNEEHVLNKDLRDIGIQVVSEDENGNQYSFHQPDNPHFRGSMDAAALGLIEAPKTWHVIDHKTANDKKFKEFKKHGTAKTQIKYWTQLMVYMAWSGMSRAMILIVNKNDDEIYSERFKFDKKEADKLIEKAKRVVFSSKPLTRLSERPDWYECKFCDAYEICHQEALPRDGCRTCCHSTPLGDGTWKCERHGHDLSDHNSQLEGCDDHLFIPDLIPAEMIAGDTDKNWIQYRKKDGTEFVNCGIHCLEEFGTDGAYLSREIMNGFKMVGDKNVDTIRREFGATLQNFEPIKVDENGENLPFSEK